MLRTGIASILQPGKGNRMDESCQAEYKSHKTFSDLKRTSCVLRMPAGQCTRRVWHRASKVEISKDPTADEELELGVVRPRAPDAGTPANESGKEHQADV